MKGLKISVAFLTLAVAGLIGYVVYQEVIVKETKTGTITEYENKISTLEKENKELKEEITTQCDNTQELPKFEGTYSFGDSNQKDVCGDTIDKIFHYRVTFHNDGTAEFSEGMFCGGGVGGSGKYYVNETEILIVDDNCNPTYNCAYYTIYNYDGENISAKNSYMGTEYTINLVKE